MKSYDVLILGSGPAGNTCAIYTIRAGLKTAIITGNDVGGQLTITTDVENFPAFPEPINGAELMNRFLKQSENLGIEVIYDYVNSVDFSTYPYVCSTANGEKIECKNLVIATGAKAKWLRLESEKKYLGYGVSGCATCDGNFFRNKIVAVVGGGNTAGTDALHLSNLASQVYIIYRKDNFFRMDKKLVERINKNDKIRILFNSEVVEIIGTEQPKKVEKLKIINNKTQEISELTVNGLFIAVGRSPNTEIFKNTELKIDEDGYIETQPDSTKTNLKHVYAVGDVMNKPFKQAIVASAYGCIAGLEIQENI